MTRGEFVSYLKARKMISKGCYYKVVGVRYVDSKTPILQTVPMVSVFSDAFLDYLLDIPPQQQIDFNIDLFPYTKPISITPYRIVWDELKELKQKLKEFFDNVFI